MNEPVPLLDVEGLRVTFGTHAVVEAVSDVSFAVREGEVLGLIGESGSGKTVTGLALLRLLPDHASVTSASSRYKGQDIARLDDHAFNALRGGDMAMIFQDPVGSFNPVKTIRWHLQAVFDESAGGKRDFELEGLLRDVGIRDTRRVLDLFPHQLSGGMLQRALIAMVFARRPSLVIADEPTTNLDNIVEGQILKLIRERQKTFGTSLIFITHDLTIAQAICDRIAVMYAGEIVEIGDTSDIINRPRHPYTAGLLRTARSLEQGDEVLFELDGEPGSRAAKPACHFSLRCPEAVPPCRTSHPALTPVGTKAAVRCILHAN